VGAFELQLMAQFEPFLGDCGLLGRFFGNLVELLGHCERASLAPALRLAQMCCLDDPALVGLVGLGNAPGHLCRCLASGDPEIAEPALAILALCVERGAVPGRDLPGELPELALRLNEEGGDSVRARALALIAVCPSQCLPPSALPRVVAVAREASFRVIRQAVRAVARHAAACTSLWPEPEQTAVFAFIFEHAGADPALTAMALSCAECAGAEVVAAAGGRAFLIACVEAADDPETTAAAWRLLGPG